MEFSIIIVTYNNSRTIGQLLDSLVNVISNYDAEIIVVDNNSQDNTEEIIGKYEGVKFIKNDVNYGFGKANNIGASIAKGELLFFVNSDVIIEKDPFDDMVKFYTQTPNIGLLGAQLKFEDGSFQRSSYGFPSLLKRSIELLGIKSLFVSPKGTINVSKLNSFVKVSSIKGAFFLVSKKIFEKVKGFDENYFMYIEDIDLSYNVQKAGYINYLYVNDYIIHLGWNIESPLNEFNFYHRNLGLIHFYKKNYNKIYYFIFVILNLIFFKIRMIFSHDKEKSVLKKVMGLYKRELFH